MKISRRAFAGSCFAGPSLLIPYPRAGLSSKGSTVPSAIMKKPSIVSTVNGPVDCDSLGVTLMHEHLLFFSGPRLDNPGYAPVPEHLRSETVEFVASLLNDAARVGIDAIVDLTPHRPIDLYDRFARRTPIKIIPSTGFYRRQKLPKQLAQMDDEGRMEEHMLKEVAEGIDSTKIRAGIIKIASEGTPLSEWEKKVFRAAARVQKSTGVPIATHDGASAREQFDFLLWAGADPSRLVLSQVDTGRRGRSRETLMEEPSPLPKK